MADPEKCKERISWNAPTLGEFPKEGGLKGWLTVLGAFCALFCTFGQLNSFGVFQTWYADNQLAHMSPSAISWIGSLQLLVFFFTGGGIGRLFDAYGPRVLMAVGTFVLLLSIMATSVSSNYPMFIIFQGIFFGIGVGLLFYPSLAAVSTHFKRLRGTAVGIALTGSGLGGVVYPIMFRRLFSQVGFGWAVRISGFICLALCLVTLATVTAEMPDERQQRPWFEWRLLQDARFQLVVFASFFISFGLFIPNFYIVDYATAHGVSSTMAFYVLAIMNAGSVVGRIAPPLLSDRFGHFNLIVPCTFLSGFVALVLWTTAHSLPGIIVFSVLFGFFSGGFNALIIPCVAQISGPAEIGTRVGMLYTLISIPSMGGAPAAGALLTRTGGSFIGIAVLSGSTVLFGSMILLWARIHIDSRIHVRV